MGEAVRLHSISPEATPEEVAAILAAHRARRHPVPATESDATTRCTSGCARRGSASHRAGLQRGPWRLSGRIGRRSRAVTVAGRTTPSS